MSTTSIYSALIVAIMVMGFPQPSTAADRYWGEGFGTLSFFSPQNWIDGSTLGIPGANDTAIFDVAGTYTVTFNNSHSTDRLLIRSGVVTFDMHSMQYSLLHSLSSTPSISVAVEQDTAWLTVKNGTLSGQFMDVGQLAGSVGLLTIDGSSAALSNQWFLRVGNQGAGIMTVQNGAQASNVFGSIAQAAGSFGQATIDGQGSAWICDGNMSVGRGGYGTLLISNGGFVECNEAIIAQLVGSMGDVVVSGPNSTWLVQGTLDVGMLGPGSLTIENGGVVETDGFAVLSTFQGGEPWKIPGEAGLGRLNLQGPDSVWHVHNDLFAGLTWYAILRIGQGGRLIVDGTLDVGPFAQPPPPDVLLTIELGASDDYGSPAVSVGETSELTFARVELVNGFVPSHGNEFHILSAAAAAPMAFALPTLPQGLEWLTLYDRQNVRLKVQCTAAGDVNDDGAVDVSDLLLVIANWGPCPGGCASPCPGDATGDCVVAVDDLLAVISTYGMCQ